MLQLQLCLIDLFEKWKRRNSNGGILGTLILHLQKAFNSLSHELSFVKLLANSFHKIYLSLVHEYLLNKTTKAKISHIVLGATYFCRFIFQFFGFQHIPFVL